MLRRLVLLFFLACVASSGLRVGEWPRSSQAASPFAAGDSLFLVKAAWLDSLPDGSLPPLQDGDSLRLITTWSRSDLNVHADLTALTSELGVADRVDTFRLRPLGPGRFELRTRIGASNTVGDGVHTIWLTAEATDETLRTGIFRCLSNRPPALSSAVIQPERDRYRGGDVLYIDTSWTSAFALEVSADFRAITPAMGDSVPAVRVGALYRVIYVIPIDPESRAPDGDGLPIVLTARDTGCGVTSDTVRINLESVGLGPAPTLLEWARLDTLEDGTPRALKNGSTIRLWTRWDQDSLRVWADHFDLAPGDTSLAEGARVGIGEYLLAYTLPDSAPRQDGAEIPFCLSAGRPGVRTARDCSVLVCLDNFDPVHVRTYLRHGTRARRGGDTLRVVTAWDSPSGLPLSVGASFTRIQPALGDSFVPAEPEGDSLVITYRIPPVEDDRGDDGLILVPLRAGEIGGCGFTFHQGFHVLLDTTPPDSAAPRLDPLPAQTTEDSILVSGSTVPEAFQIALTRQGSFQKYVRPDPFTGRFSGMVQLLPDEENLLRAWAEDSLRNRTRSSDPQIVLQVSAARITVPAPFERGAEITIRDPRSIRGLVLDLFDLQGSLVRRWRVPGPAFEVGVAWDGTDEEGARARQGYYLVRAEWRDDQGRSYGAEEGLVLGN